MNKEPGARYALVLDPCDNVATLLFDASHGEIVALKGAGDPVTVREDIGFGHKIALRAIAAGDRIMKYGQEIGYATSDISEGEWVHLHNMASALDADFRKRIEQ